MKKFLLMIIMCSFCCTVLAQTVPPDVMIQNVSQQLITALKQNKGTLKNNPNATYNLVRSILLPHLAVDDMAKRAVGRDNWMKASPEQKSQFLNEFSNLLFQTYASAFAQYTDESIQLLPHRSLPAGSTHLQVDSKILRNHSSGPAINVSYQLEIVNNEWKVYDFSVEGISIMESFRSQFMADLQNGGLGVLNSKLAQHQSAMQA